MFGLSYRTRVGNDVDGTDFGYKLHLLYGCQAAPSEKAYATINDSPEAIAFSWEITTTPVPVTDYQADLSHRDRLHGGRSELILLLSRHLLYGEASVDGSSSDSGRCHRSLRKLP